jgi:hypothetical protein
VGCLRGRVAVGVDCADLDHGYLRLGLLLRKSGVEEVVEPWWVTVRTRNVSLFAPLCGFW